MKLLSEQPKPEDRIKRISDVSRNERNGLMIVLVGVFLVNAGLIISAIGNTIATLVGGSFFIALGAFSTLFGFFVSLHYGRKYTDLLEE